MSSLDNRRGALVEAKASVIKAGQRGMQSRLFR